MTLADTNNRSTADLVRMTGEQISTLVRDEVRLAKAELAEKGRRAGHAAGAFGGAGIAALYGVGALITASILALALALPAWAAALIVGVVLLLVAGALALMGRRSVKRAVPVVPTAAVHSVRSDIDAVTTAVHERNNHE